MAIYYKSNGLNLFASTFFIVYKKNCNLALIFSGCIINEKPVLLLSHKSPYEVLIVCAGYSDR